MKLFNLFVFGGIFIAINLGVAIAEPFEVRGYHQGMSYQEVNTYALNHGHTITSQNNTENFFRITQGEMEFVNLSFCNDRLSTAYWLVHGGVDRFVKQLASLTMLGLHKNNFSWDSFMGYDGKEHFNLTVTFTKPGSEKDYYVTATLYASEQYGTTNSQITWKSYDSYCKKIEKN